MTGNMELKYQKYKLENYIMDMLTLETCKIFLPAAFIQTEEEVIASYRTEGFCNLSTLKEIETEDLLSVVLSLLEGIDDAQRHYIFPNEYVVNDESVYVQKDLHQAKLIFIPEKEDIALNDKIVALLENLKEKGTEDGKEYMEDAIAFVRQNTFGGRAVIRHLEKLRKEVFLCGVK